MKTLLTLTICVLLIPLSMAAGYGRVSAVNAQPLPTPAPTLKQILETPLSEVAPDQKVALIIGIDSYDNYPSLNDCDNDAHNFANFVRDKLKFTQITVMTDDTNDRRMTPTYTHITREIGALTAHIVKDQTQIVLFYSGHGLRHGGPDMGDDDWLVPSDAVSTDLVKTCIDFTAFENNLRTEQPGRALLFVDACRNINQNTQSTIVGSGFGGTQMDLGEQFAEIQSCEPSQVSQEGDPTDFHESVFTHFLLTGLDGQAIDPTASAVTYDSLMRFVKNNVIHYTDQKQGFRLQVPTGIASTGDMVLARPIPGGDAAVNAPDFQVRDTGGALFSLSANQGKVVVIDFWATWTDQSIKSVLYLAKIEQDYASKGVVFVPVLTGTTKAEFDNWLGQNPGFTLPVYLDPAETDNAQNIAFRLYQADKLPMQYVIGKDGKIFASLSGYDSVNDPDETGLRQAIDSAISENH